jgi:SAM-dependent methyltransferase
VCSGRCRGDNGGPLQAHRTVPCITLIAVGWVRGSLPSRSSAVGVQRVRARKTGWRSPNVFEHPSRAAWQKPDQVVAELALDAGQTVADSCLPAHCCDLLFLCNTYHMIEDRLAYLRHLERRLRPGGRIAIVDWRKAPLPQGPQPQWKLTEGEVVSELDRAGLCVAERAEFLPYQYFLVATPCAASERGAGRVPVNVP